MDNKRGVSPGYGRGRAARRTNFHNTVNSAVNYLAPRDLYRQIDYSVFGRGQPFPAMSPVPHVSSGAKLNNSTIRNNPRRGNISWADIRQQSQLSGFMMRTLEPDTFQPDKSHHFSNRPSNLDGPWGGRGRGILEKVSSDDESSWYRNQNSVWGGRGRGSILGSPKFGYENASFRPFNGIGRGQNKPHRGQFRSLNVKNQSISATNRIEQMPGTVPMIPTEITLPLLFEQLDVNFSCGKQEQNESKKKQQRRKNVWRGRKGGSLGKGGSGRAAKDASKSCLQTLVSHEGQQNDVDTETGSDREKSVLSNTKRVVVINSQLGSIVKIPDKQDPSKSHYQSDDAKGKLINEVNKNSSNEEKPQEGCKIPSNYCNRTLILTRESTGVVEGATDMQIVKPLSEIINPNTGDNIGQQNSNKK